MQLSFSALRLEISIFAPLSSYEKKIFMTKIIYRNNAKKVFIECNLIIIY